MGNALTPTLLAKLAAHRLYHEAGLDPLIWEVLESEGVDYRLILNLVGPICRRPVTFLEGGSFVYDELGESAFLMVVVGEDCENELDVVAWAAREPSIFGTLLNQAHVIGASNILNPASYADEKPCPLWMTPLDWLRSGCQGACVLAGIPASPIFARAPGQLAAEDLDHARELVRSGAVPREILVVPAPDRRVA